MNLTKEQALKKAAIIRKNVDTLERRFRREHPNLVKYLDSEYSIDDCKVGYYRDRLKSHIRKTREMKKQANKIESFSRRQMTLFK